MQGSYDVKCMVMCVFGVGYVCVFASEREICFLSTYNFLLMSCVVSIVSVTCVHVLLLDCRSSCLHEGQ